MPLTLPDLRRRRIHNQLLSRPSSSQPVDVVSWMGAVQAQDYLGALWAVGQRARAGDREVERALAERTIVRTWPMRGTLHFVPAADVRWMLQLLTPRVLKRMTPAHEREGLDERVFARCRRILVRALEGGRGLTRPQIYQHFGRDGIRAAGQRGLHILWRLAAEGLICFGARAGKQQTFVLLDEWLPATPTPTRDEALALLAWRYFRSHGPATLKDFVWWSGLTVAEAQAALHLVEDSLDHEALDGETHWFTGTLPVAARKGPVAHLLPPFDEYLVGYKERGAAVDSRFAARLGALLSPSIELDGAIVGTWRRRITRKGVEFGTTFFHRLKVGQRDAVERAAAEYRSFLAAGNQQEVVGRSG
jgi:Winged helix DNA-binding domain